MTTAPIDDDLASTVADAIGRGGEPFCVALVDAEGARVAVRGMDRGGDVEIGSVTKGLTGLLLHDAVERGEVTMNDSLGTHLDVGNGPIGGVTFADLATHGSGLPRGAPQADMLGKSWRLWTRAENPYGETLDELVHSVRDLDPKPTKRPRYSNMGFMLLGHAVAAAAGQRYAELVSSRLAEPLDLDGLYDPYTPQELHPQAQLGRNRLGKTAQAWTGEALGPAGGVRATVDDLASLTAALLDGAAPGVTALDPVKNFAGPAVTIGSAWLTMQAKGRTITWHNGGTGGFRSFLGLDREAGRGVALVRSSTRSADQIGFDLLAGSRGAPR